MMMLEFCALTSAFYAAFYVRFLGDGQFIAHYFGSLLPRGIYFAAVMILALAAMGLYQTHSRERIGGQLGRTVVAFVLGGLAQIAAFYVLPSSYIGRGAMALALLFGFVFTLLVRYLFTAAVNQGSLKRRVLVVGAGARANLLVERMRRAADRRGFQLLGFVPIEGEDVRVPGTQRLDGSKGIHRLVQQLDIDEIVVGPDERRGCLPIQDLLECRVAGVPVIDLATFFEREAGKVKLGLIDPSWLIFSSGFDRRQTRRATKRAFDVLVSVFALVLSLPLMLVTALAILLESGWRSPILFRQLRVGEDGTPFVVLKFRSMRTDAESDGVARWASADDDRVTRVGRLIRKLRIDELPQIFNVLRGEMSFVGPRPERPEFVEELSKALPFYRLRHNVKPGITGWAQLRYPYGASVEDALEKLKFDLYYVKNHSLLFDTAILLQTVEVVLFRKGSR